MDLTLEKNTGVLIAPRPGDWQAGGPTGIVYEKRLREGDWTLYLPSDERQHFRLFDTMACVSFSALNSVETQMNWLLASGMVPEHVVQKIRELGFLDDFGKFNCSDRFTAKMSGTTQNGNYLQNVWDSIRKDGLLPERDWPSDENFTWEGYYAEIPQDLKDKAKIILTIIDVAYEWVAMAGQTGVLEAIVKHLKQAPLQLAGPTCPPWNTTEIVQPCGSCNPSHATLIYSDQNAGWIDDFDHYDPYRKRISREYCMPWIMKGVVSLRENPAAPDAPGMEITWKPSPNFRKGRKGAKPEAIVLHISTGSIGSAEPEDESGPVPASLDNTFQNPSSGVSAHYGVAKIGAIHQYVKEADEAFHAGIVENPNWSLLKPDMNPNLYTIGIEHEGKHTDIWPEAQRAASAALVKNIAARYGIPLDRDHVIGHYQISGTRRENCPAVDKSIIDEIIRRARGEHTFSYVFKVSLRYGMPASPEVRKLQEALQFLGYLKRGVFGPYGPQTKDALRRFQEARGIMGDYGINFGPRSRAEMNKALAHG